MRRNELSIIRFKYMYLSTWLRRPKSSEESWAYSFVRWDNTSYVTSGAEELDKNQIGEEIGSVKTYSTDDTGYDMLDPYEENFSNEFPVGTTYYKINGVDTNEAIAVEIGDGSFIKAVNSEIWMENNS
ncbi:hypothetical protein [Lentibacillus sediminis]|uniref:hypothetical protein n=1 Tax=Lentibacillus sediminis TaxID=1940529 RepID=UPI00195A308F|nr:hypothetical protein [Lentibacillus sediminis]